MAFGTNFDMDFGLSGACNKVVAAVATYFALMKFRVYAFSHYIHLVFVFLK